MTTNSPLQLLQTSVRVAIGATNTVVELLQDTQKREDTFTKFQQELHQLVQEWAATGEQIEQQARQSVEKFFPSICTTTKYPQYVERGGELVYLQPFQLKGTKLNAFVLEGTLNNLQQLCDKYLNNPTNGQTHYRPVTHYVLITFQDIQSISSIDKPDSEKGFFHEQEVAFWVLTMAGRKVGPAFIVERLAWFNPYMFVDSPHAMAGGREIYGFPKELGWFSIPFENQEPERFSLETIVLKDFSPQTEGIRQQLLEVRRVEGSANRGFEKTFENPQEGFEEIVRLLFNRDGRVDVMGLGLLVNLFDYLTHQEVPMVFLKQFRDASDGKQACYQAIVETVSKLRKFRRGKLLGEQFQLIVNDFASHPIIQELGLEKREQLVKLAFWLDFDFTIENGTEIWKAPSNHF